jgi:hypothetical protein
VVRDAQEAVRQGVQLQILKAGTEGEIDAIFAALLDELHAGALLGGADRFLINPLFLYRGSSECYISREK